MKGIILAGGKGSRLFPVTSVVSKQLLPVYDKPMIYYPLSVLLLAGIRDVLLISTPNDIRKYEELLGDGNRVKDPNRYGVIEFDSNGNALSIEEKPEIPKSDKAVVGLYFYPNEVLKIAKTIKPSNRGELEITAINQCFLKNLKLKVETLGQEFTWLDTGTHESLLKASQFIETIEKRQGLKIGCLEEIAFKKGYITLDKLLENAKKLSGSSYGEYLLEYHLNNRN